MCFYASTIYITHTPCLRNRVNFAIPHPANRYNLLVSFTLMIQASFLFGLSHPLQSKLCRSLSLHKKYIYLFSS